MAVSGIWGASFLFIAVGLEALTPGVVTFLRVGLGAAALHLLPGPSIRVEPEDRLRLLGVSILWVAIPFTLFPIPEQPLNSAVTGMLNGSTPVFTALFAVLLFGRRPPGPQLTAVAVGSVGIVIVRLPSSRGGYSREQR